tara:strand:- start:324 stop:446 length:123 start_codon:yes stop_codon:yes gene_type:complete
MRKAFMVLRTKKILGALFEKKFIAIKNKLQKNRLKTSIEA